MLSRAERLTLKTELAELEILLTQLAVVGMFDGDAMKLWKELTAKLKEIEHLIEERLS